MQIRKLLAAGMILFLMLGIGVTSALADTPTDDPISFTGTVTAIDEAAGTIHVQVLDISEIVVYLVHVPAGFDFGLLEELDVVDVVALNRTACQATIIIHPDDSEPIRSPAVTEIDEDAGTIQEVLGISEMVVYLVHVPAGFDFSLLEPMSSM
jgi:hypothetical protein